MRAIAIYLCAYLRLIGHMDMVMKLRTQSFRLPMDTDPINPACAGAKQLSIVYHTVTFSRADGKIVCYCCVFFINGDLE